MRVETPLSTPTPAQEHGVFHLFRSMNIAPMEPIFNFPFDYFRPPSIFGAYNKC